MSKFDLNKKKMKKKNKEKIANPEHFEDTHLKKQSHTAIPKQYSKKKTGNKGHFPSHIWAYPQENKKGQKI